jgi:hypothetical protein
LGRPILSSFSRSPGHEVVWHRSKRGESLPQIPLGLSEDDVASAAQDFNFVDVEAEFFG